MSTQPSLKAAGSWRNLFDDLRSAEHRIRTTTLEHQVEEWLKNEVGFFSPAEFHVKRLDRGYAELTFPYTKMVARQGGTIHGGVICFALDEASELAVRT